MNPPAHAAGAPATHAPAPLHVLVVSMPLRQLVPHPPPAAGYSHAPVPAAHPVAPHVGTVEQAVAQQSPVPFTPQVLLAHTALEPQACPAASRHSVPPTHAMLGAHPTAGAVHVVAHAVALPQAKPFGHAAVAGVPHAPLVHVLTCVSVAFAHDAAGQTAQAPPVAPHAGSVLPATHVPALQHPPLHATDAEQSVSHDFVVVLQFTFAGQSVAATWQPQPPPVPVVAGTHAVPALMPAQLVQTPPVEPHAVAASPVVHVPLVAAEQQPPLHACVELHAVVHAWVESHASPSGQSLADWHPQTPVAALQVAPASPVTQFLQTVPAAPHALADWLGAHTAPLQHVPLHSCDAEHAVVQVPFETSQANPAGQPLGPVHPASAASAPASWGPVSGTFASVPASTFPSGTVTSAPESPASGVGIVESVPVSTGT